MNKKSIYDDYFWFTIVAILFFGSLLIISLKKHYKMQEKPYYVKELRATIYATSDEEFERKKEKLSNRGQRHLTGGKSTSKITTLNADGFTFKTTNK